MRYAIQYDSTATIFEKIRARAGTLGRQQLFYFNLTLKRKVDNVPVYKWIKIINGLFYFKKFYVTPIPFQKAYRSAHKHVDASRATANVLKDVRKKKYPCHFFVCSASIPECRDSVSAKYLFDRIGKPRWVAVLHSSLVNLKPNLSSLTSSYKTHHLHQYITYKFSKTIYSVLTCLGPLRE